LNELKHRRSSSGGPVENPAIIPKPEEKKEDQKVKMEKER